MSVNIIKIENQVNILHLSSSVSIPSKEMVRFFNPSSDYIEMHVININTDDIIYTISPFNNYNIPGTFQPGEDVFIEDIIFNPDTDLKNLGIVEGNYKVQYNILRPKINGSSALIFFIKEISSDKKELRLITTNISSPEVETGTLDFINEIQSLRYFKEFYLNFGNNKLIPAVNVALDKNTSPYSVLIKLIDPIPTEFKTGNYLGVVDALSNPQVFEVEITLDPIPVTYPTLRGPNFDLDLDNLRVGPTPYYNFTEVTSFQGNFAPQLEQLLGQLSASNFALNVDYTNYENFVHYSSAAKRLEGFKYKLTNIEEYTAASASLAESNSPTTNLDAQNFQNKINNTIQSFDGYEQYLYFESSSYAWPKSTSTKPYINYLTTDYQSLNWFYAQQEVAELYDDNNQNYILYTLPSYITENTDNELVFNFIASIGQMFDDIWIHIKAITDLYKAKNALDEGISKDLVYFALQSMGINAYTDEAGTNVFKYLYGVDENGNYLPNTGSYETLVTASQYQLSGQDQQKGIYKRLYSNLPLLLKSKGTNRFVQYLNTIFGIPTTIMGSLEYGGVDKVTSSFEYEYDKFTYALQSSGSNSISIPWNYTSQSLTRTGYNDIVPNGIEFRFKAYPTASNPATQSLFYSGSAIQFNLLYRNTGSSNSIYSGSTGEFGYFQFKLGGLSVTSSTVPIYYTGSNSDSDNSTDWYSVLIQRTNPDLRIGQTSTSQTYTFYVKNNVWGEVGHVASASLTTATATTNSLWYTQGTMTFLGDSNPFSGSIQELRLWSNYVSESTFDSHVLNPESIEGNYTSSAFNDLATRFTLGNNLYTYNHSLTSSVASTHPDQKTQILNATFANFPNRNNYTSFTETYYADVANSGYANPVTDKIRIVSGSEYGTQLMPNKSIEIQPLIPITKDIHLLDASLSPQDEVDRAIIAQFGSTYNLDDIIGNPATGSYNELTVLQTDFFKKFTNKYNYKDYIRLIEFFHNSLFRTLKDFTPARTNLSTGIVIKPHLLERSRVQRYNPTVDNKNNETVTINTAFFTGSNGGDYSQSLYPITIQNKVGKVTITSDARDFFTGELPSASINTYVDQVNPFTKFNPQLTSSYSESIWAHDYDALLNNVSSSISSSIRKRVCYITSGSKLKQVLETAYLQDFTYQYARHKNPRYNGVQTTSANYNIYSDNDGNVGLYGRNASIDKNTRKFAFFSEIIATGSDLIAMPERSNVYITYLVDESSSLTELSKRNYDILSEDQKYNLTQVQNTFKAGEKLNITLFDKENPSRQPTLDGNKQIFVGGFKFHPVLWRTGSYSLVYKIDEKAFYQGNPGGDAPYSLSDFYIDVFQSERANDKYAKYRIIKNTGNVAGDINITATVRVLRSSGNYNDHTFTLLMKNGTNTTDYSSNYARKNAGPNRINLITLAGSDSKTNYSYIDTVPTLSVNQTDKTIISCSLGQSQYFNNFTFSGSEATKEIIDYPFSLNKGDLIRFTSGSTSTTFSSFYEYEIIDVYPPVSNTSLVAFKISSVLPNVCTSSAGSITKYIFSRKIPDETNIVIQHAKNPGQTSAGVAKNSNIALDIDQKLANIVSELKNKLFSTVLTR